MNQFYVLIDPKGRWRKCARLKSDVTNFFPRTGEYSTEMWNELFRTETADGDARAEIFFKNGWKVELREIE